MLLLAKIKPNKEPLEVPLLFTALWVQIDNLSLGMHSESLARQFGNFIGTFLEYDANAIVAGFQNFMRVRVEINVCKSLKRRKKLLFAKMKECYATFKYEKLTTFCFLYGRLGHGESYCPIRMVEGSKDLLLAWSISLKAPPRRTVGDDSIWLLKPGETGQKLRNFWK